MTSPKAAPRFTWVPGDIQFTSSSADTNPMYNASTGVSPARKQRVAIADLVKVGPEGYIHGWICVRPPCGPKAKAVVREDGVHHDFQTGEAHPRYVVENGETGQRIGDITPRADDDGNVTYTGRLPQAVSPTAPGAEPEDVLHELSIRHNLSIMRDHADARGLPMAVRDLLQKAYAYNSRGEPWRAEESLRLAAKALDEMPPVLDPRGYSREKERTQLRRGVEDVYHDLTGQELPPSPLKPPTEPWAKTGKVRLKDLEYEDGKDGHYRAVIHRPTGIQIGTVDQEWLSPTHPHAVASDMYYDSKAYYTVRHADGTVVSYAASDANKSGLDKGVTRLIDAHNKRLAPRIPVNRPVPDEPARKAPPWFNPDDVITETPAGLPVDKELATRQEVSRQLENQARYVPNVVARATVKVVDAKLGRSSTLADHAGWNGTIRITSKITDTLGDPNVNARMLQRDTDNHWWVPHAPGLSLLDTITAHEMGHGVADRGLKARYDVDSSMWKDISDGIGIMQPLDLEGKNQYDRATAINRWIGSNKAKISREVSRYGTTNMHELLAELWGEYTTSSSPRPPAKAYGDYVMSQMANRTTDPSKVST